MEQGEVQTQSKRQLYRCKDNSNHSSLTRSKSEIVTVLSVNFAHMRKIGIQSAGFQVIQEDEVPSEAS